MKILKQILKNCYGYFEPVNIRKNTSTLEYLKRNEQYRFMLKQIYHGNRL